MWDHEQEEKAFLECCQLLFFILNCTQDVRKWEHDNSITVIFVSAEAMEEEGGSITIKEHLRGLWQNLLFLEWQKLSLNSWQKCKSLGDLRSQEYGSGANMESKHSRVQKRLWDLNRRHFFVLCNTWPLSFVLIDVVNCYIKPGGDFQCASKWQWDIMHQHVAY